MACCPALASLSHLSDAKRSERAALEASIAFFEHCIDAVLYTAPDGRILDANEAAVELLRMPCVEICRRGRFGLADPNDPRWETAVEERARTGRFMGPLSFRRGDDTFVECVISSSIFPNHDGELRAIVVMREATPTTTDDVRPEHRLVDRETGVYTRPAFVVVVEQQCRIALRDQSGLVLLYIDLVEQGASAASRRPFANMLTSLCRRGDLVARLGRDEFAILVREESRRGASALVDRIRARLDDPDEGDELRDLHVHVGITTIDPSAGMPIERLLDDVTRHDARPPRARARATLATYRFAVHLRAPFAARNRPTSPATRAPRCSPTANARCCGCSRAGARTPRSRASSTSRSTPSRVTSRTSTPSSVRPDAPTRCRRLATWSFSCNER